MNPLDDPRAAFAYAGKDEHFTLARLRTVALTRNGETGVFEAKAQAPLAELSTRADPVGWLKAFIRFHLASAIRHTGVPMEKWIVEFSPALASYNLPSHLFLSSPKDQEWLV